VRIILSILFLFIGLSFGQKVVKNYPQDFTATALTKIRAEMAVGGTPLWNISGNLVYYNLGGVAVGKASISSGKTFDVLGDVLMTGNFQLVDGTESAGYVLTSDASGNASWQTATGGSVDLAAVVAVVNDSTFTHFYSDSIVAEKTIVDTLEVNSYIDMQANGIVNLKDPLTAQDAATKIYVDTDFLNSSLIRNFVETGNLTGWNWDDPQANTDVSFSVVNQGATNGDAGVFVNSGSSPYFLVSKGIPVSETDFLKFSGAIQGDVGNAHLSPVPVLLLGRETSDFSSASLNRFGSYNVKSGEIVDPTTTEANICSINEDAVNKTIFESFLCADGSDENGTLLLSDIDGVDNTLSVVEGAIIRPNCHFVFIAIGIPPGTFRVYNPTAIKVETQKKFSGNLVEDFVANNANLFGWDWDTDPLSNISVQVSAQSGNNGDALVVTNTHPTNEYFLISNPIQINPDTDALKIQTALEGSAGASVNSGVEMWGFFCATKTDQTGTISCGNTYSVGDRIERETGQSNVQFSAITGDEVSKTPILTYVVPNIFPDDQLPMSTIVPVNEQILNGTRAGKFLQKCKYFRLGFYIKANSVSKIYPPRVDRVDIQADTKSSTLSGTGSPEGFVTAPVGKLYTRTDGGAGTTLYVKESGTGNIGWVAK